MTDLVELRERFCFTSEREEMYEQLADVLTIVTRNLRRVSSLWIGGSFVSGLVVAKDVDVVFVVPANALAHAKQVMGAAGEVADRLIEGEFPEFPAVSAQLLADFGPFVGHPSEASLDVKKSLAQRGYWDHLWQSARDDRDQPIPADHGYLEVMIDGYAQQGLA